MALIYGRTAAKNATVLRSAGAPPPILALFELSEEATLTCRVGSR